MFKPTPHLTFDRFEITGRHVVKDDYLWQVEETTSSKVQLRILGKARLHPAPHIDGELIAEIDEVVGVDIVRFDDELYDFVAIWVNFGPGSVFRVVDYISGLNGYSKWTYGRKLEVQSIYTGTNGLMAVSYVWLDEPDNVIHEAFQHIWDAYLKIWIQTSR